MTTEHNEVQHFPEFFDPHFNHYYYHISNFTMLPYWSFLNPIFDLIQPTSLIEIGAAQGHMTRLYGEWARQHNAEMTVIDIAPLDDLKRTLAEEQLQHVELKVGGSLDVLPTVSDKDCFIIDGDHNYYTVSNELRIIHEHNSPRLIVMHDMGWPWAYRDSYYDVQRIPEGERQPVNENLYDGIVPTIPGVVPHFGHTSALSGFHFASTEGGAKNGVVTALNDFLETYPHYEVFKVEGFFGIGVLVRKDSPHLEGVRAILAPYVNNPMIRDLERARLEMWFQAIQFHLQLQPLLNSRALRWVLRWRKVKERILGS